MEFDEYQTKARKTAIYPEVGNNLIYTVLGLAGEAGEMANKVKKLIRKYNFKQGDSIYNLPVGLIKELRDELGDVGWYYVMTAFELKSLADDIAGDNLRKLSKRSIDNEIIDHDQVVHKV